MNVAIFTDVYPPFINGVSTSAYNLAETLRNHGDNVLVITPRSSKGKIEVIDNVIYMPGLENKKLYGYRLTKIYDRKVVKMIRDFKPDVIHNQTDIGLGAFARIYAKKFKTPLVYTYHTDYGEYSYYLSKGVLDRAVKAFLRTYSRGIMKGCNEFITPSQKTMDTMRAAGGDGYINVIPTGIDFSIYDESRIDKDKLAKFKLDHKIDDDTTVFLILGRLAKEKSMDVSITYLSDYFLSHPSLKAKVLVVGGGPELSNLEFITHEKKVASYFDFIGSVPASEVPFYYNLADIYVSASTTETQGLTFNEAMAGKDILLLKFDNSLEDTIVDGETGFFFTEEKSFNDKLNRILSLDKEGKQRIINNALKSNEKYSIETFYKNIIGVYKRAIRELW